MKLYEFLDICNNYDKLIDFLIKQKVIHGSMNCIKCGKEMKFNRQNLIFLCHTTSYIKNRNRKRVKIQCNLKVSAYKNSWFEQSRFPIQNVCRFIGYHLMLRPPRQAFMENELSISSKTAVDWASFCRELCVLWIDKNSVQIGGDNIIVEIDEAKVGKRKYNKGRLVTGQWIFGGVERGSKRLFIEPVPDRSSETLLRVIHKWIKPGNSII